MFTGLVEELGEVSLFQNEETKCRIKIKAKTVLEGVQIGDSIAVNGCCLTVVTLSNDSWEADIVPETLKRTCLGLLKVGDRVNLERPLRLNSFLGGHLVQGHVDGLGIIKSKKQQADDSWLFTFSTSPEHLRYAIQKGSIAIDGISLTLVNVGHDIFQVAIIPHTYAKTTLGFKQEGDAVNLELDLIAKYLEKLVQK
ncbi:MAG: riboflavin synthase alpha chain [Chlamydiales bacterium]|jgi:riboflavin synthase|nr:riboflavin synthase alpha chain [Chlamydiales bacterium]